MDSHLKTENPIDTSKLGPKAREWHNIATPFDPMFHSNECLEAFITTHAVEIPILHVIPEYLLPDDPYTNPLHSATKQMIKGKGKKKVDWGECAISFFSFSP